MHSIAIEVKFSSKLFGMLCIIESLQMNLLRIQMKNDLLVHRDEAIMLLTIMLFCNVEHFVKICLRWTLIMPNLFHIAYG